MSGKLRYLLGVCLVLTAGPALADVAVRVATFNIEHFKQSQGQFDAAVAILERIGADVVCVQEIDETSDFNDLATAAGYPWYKVLASGSNSFDSSHHAGIMSVYPFSHTATETAATISSDGSARDITRNFIVAEIIVPGAAEDLVVIGNHWKAGFDDSDEFRRSVESTRAMQITAEYDSTVIPYIIVGDMNDDISDSADSPSQFTTPPSGLPAGFSLGGDIPFPLANGIFKPFQAGTGSQRLWVVNARQKDYSDSTRPASGRRLDYIWRSGAVVVIGSEVYDSEDEGLSGGLTKYGSALASGTSTTASDHLPVFADILIPDNQSGACCTACGCDDTVNEAQCLALGGEFRGAGVMCGEENPPCVVGTNGIVINEVVVAHEKEDPQDPSLEFIELAGDPHSLLCGLTILVIEGDSLSKGRIDQAVSLDDCDGQTCKLDENGYFVIGGDGLDPAPDIILTGTSIFEDGTSTIALVRDSTVAVGDDIDQTGGFGDGIADFDPGLILDVVGVKDAGSNDAVYYDAPELGPYGGSSVAPGGARCPDGATDHEQQNWIMLSLDMFGADGCLEATPGQSNPLACGGDFDGDGDLDLNDFAGFQACIGLATPACSALELDGQCGITVDDLEFFVGLLSGPE